MRAASLPTTYHILALGDEIPDYLEAQIGKSFAQFREHLLCGFAPMQLTMHGIGDYEVICAELIDDLWITFVPVFSKPSGYYGFVILLFREAWHYFRCWRNAFANWVFTRSQRG